MNCSRKDFLFLWTWLSWNIRFFIPESGDFIIIGWNDRLFLQKSNFRLSVRGNRVVFSVQAGLNRLKPVFLYNFDPSSVVYLVVFRFVWFKNGPVWSSVSKIGQNRHIEIAFLKLNWGQFRILSTVWSHLKIEFNYNSKVIWPRSCEVKCQVTERITLSGSERTVVSYWR